MIKRIIFSLLILLIGIIIGGIVFSPIQPRSFLALKNCEGNCLKRNELAGLIAALGITYTPALIPNVIKETEKVVVIQHPKPEAPIHYVFVPKKDIKNIAEVTPDDQPYIEEVFTTLSQIIEEKGWKRYRVITNGPGFQDLTYLHFHLLVYE